MAPDPAPRKRPGLSENLSGQELFVYDADGHQLTVLNRTALMVWSLCDGTHTPDDMAELLKRIFPDAEPEQLRTDIHTCLETFASDSLLV